MLFVEQNLNLSKENEISQKDSSDREVKIKKLVKNSKKIQEEEEKKPEPSTTKNTQPEKKKGKAKVEIPKTQHKQEHN